MDQCVYKFNVLEAEVLWSGLQFVLILKLLKEHFVMLKDVIKVSLLQKGQNDRIKNIVSVFYGIQCSLNNFELSVTINSHYRVYRRHGERFMDQCVYESDCFGGGSVIVKPSVLELMVTLSSKLFKERSYEVASALVLPPDA
jgi:hypothetical protein